ncbi:uncharacterized protein LOC115628891 [Scaptodrosophila lebanonensis]|uniref:Uncharacterized protein LOC115628891 n=1 Tax=Drosophila lebanonensis TaxID=7225 RepID=A0A6J2TY04_DROLE|nr:uncharacterized protein LOC115628891 [Scaptodrosophila lebanonensis]
MPRLRISGQPTVQLQPYHSYRFGSSPIVELQIEHESVEQFHGALGVSPDFVVRLVAWSGKVYVNGEDVAAKDIGFEIADDRGFVELRFGDVPAELYFESTMYEDTDSGYEDGYRGAPPFD